MNTITKEKHLPDDFTLPKVLKVEVGTVTLPTRLDGVESLREYETLNRETTHLLALIPAKDKESAELDEDGIHITTNNLPALKYACNKYLLCSYFTAIDVVLNTYGEDVCNDCIDDLIEEVADNYEPQVLTDGLYLVRVEA